jgi:hypothetical protein
MSKKTLLITFLTWLFALTIWQLLFHSHAIVGEILWEIHTIFSSVIVFYVLLNLFLKEEQLDFIKIGFRIVFKVWLIIFISFSMQNSFNQKGFLLTSTFIFGYLEGLIDVNAWLRQKKFTSNSTITNYTNTKKDKIATSIIIVSIIHVFCAFIALLFFNIG